MAFASHLPQKTVRALLLPLSAHARLRLFRDSRLVATALILTLFPALALASAESWAVTSSLVLFAAMPVVIALDVCRVAMLDRAVKMSLLCMAAVLAGGVLKGMDGLTAGLLLAVAVLEGIIVSSSRNRRKISVVGIGACFALMGLEMFQAAQVTASQPSTMLAAALAVLNVLMLVRGLAEAVQVERANTREQRLIGNEIGDIVSETVVSCDSNGNIMRVSSNCERLLGLEPASLLGKGLLELVLVSDRPAFLSALAAGPNSDAPVATRIRLRRNAGSARPSYRWVEMTVRTSVGAHHSSVATLRDVDALVIEQDRLNCAAAQAEAAKQAQAVFLSTVNHELRTPLNAIIGFSDVLAQPATMPSDPERVAEYARIIRGAGHDLLRMVTSMIDITRLDSGVYDFEPELNNAATLIDAMVEAFGQDPQSADVCFAIKHTGSLPDMPVDARVLRSIMHQLLSNAVKFGNGAVDVSTRASNGHCEISVTDHGAGIAPERLAHIGRSFARLDDSLNRERGGLGLGLSLANALARLHGGVLRISSENCKGTTATLCLPLGSEDVASLPGNVTELSTVSAPVISLHSASAAPAHKKARRRHG